MAASRSTRQVSEPGPKTPSIDPAAASQTVSRLLSKSSSDNNVHPCVWQRDNRGQAHRIQVRAVFSLLSSLIDFWRIFGGELTLISSPKSCEKEQLSKV